MSTFWYRSTDFSCAHVQAVLALRYYQCMGDKASYSVHTVIVLAPTALDPSLYLAIRARPCLRFHN